MKTQAKDSEHLLKIDIKNLTMCDPKLQFFTLQCIFRIHLQPSLHAIPQPIRFFPPFLFVLAAGNSGVVSTVSACASPSQQYVDRQTKDLFLTFRCFCTRKDVCLVFVCASKAILLFLRVEILCVLPEISHLCVTKPITQISQTTETDSQEL